MIGGVEGETDFHLRLTRCMETTSAEADQKDVAPLDFRCVAPDHNFMAKKASKDNPSLDGVLRGNWLLKHHEQLPSAVILLVTFCADWSSNEWLRRELMINERYTKIKSIISARDVKIVVVAVKTGAVLSADKDVIEERLNSLKRHLQLDSKTLISFSPPEVAPSSAFIRKLVKTIRDFSTAYYTAQGKKAKAQEKAVPAKNSFEAMLVARYSFKFSFFSECLGSRSQALKGYSSCFKSLLDAAVAVDEDLIDQVKALAEYTNFKICNMLFRGGSAKEAVQQFRLHINRFVRVYCDMQWKHFSWVSEQFVVFAQLLERYQVTSADLNPDLDRSYYYQNAARFALKRQAAFERIRDATHGLWTPPVGADAPSDPSEASSGTGFDQMATKFRGMVIVSPRYFGSLPQMLDPVLDQVQHSHNSDPHNVLKQYMEDKEKQVDHSGIIMNLLKLAHDNMDPKWKRRRSLIRVSIADQYMHDGDFDLAMTNLTPAVETLIAEGWCDAVIPLLRKKLSCAMYLGRPRDGLVTAMTLYALAASTACLDRQERDRLHRDVMSIITSTGRTQALNTPSEGGKAAGGRYQLAGRQFVSRWAASGSAVPYISFMSRGEFGEAATPDQPPEFVLPHGYTVDMSRHTRMFSLHTRFERPLVEVGRSLRVVLTMTSSFFNAITFDEMSVHFTSDVLVKRFRHAADNSLLTSSSAPAPEGRDSGSGAGNEGDRAPMEVADGPLRSAPAQVIRSGADQDSLDDVITSLEFMPRQSVVFSFLLFVPENSLNSLSGPDSSIYVERIKLVKRTPWNPGGCAGPADAGATNSPTSTNVSEKEREGGLLPVDSSPSPDSENEKARSTSSSPTSFHSSLSNTTTSSSNPLGRDVVFDLSALSTVFLTARDGFGKGLSLRELVEYVGPRESPAVLEIGRPPALLSLAGPLEPVVLLQGPVQRVDVLFLSGDGAVKSGRAHMSSDFECQDIQKALFWYPETSSVDEKLIDDAGHLDALCFHPIILNANKQPAVPMILPDQDPNTVFSIPLFLRSESQASFKIKLVLEYVPRAGFTSFLTKEFELKVSFTRALQMSYLMTSLKDAPCGVVRDTTPMTVLMGDVMSMCATLTCVNSLNKSVEVTEMVLVTKSDDDSFDPADENFQLPDGNTVQDLLRKHSPPSGHDDGTGDVLPPPAPVSLCGGEVYVASVNIQCVGGSEALAGSKAGKPLSASMGRLLIDWRVADKTLLQPPNFQTILAQEKVSGPLIAPCPEVPRSFSATVYVFRFHLCALAHVYFIKSQG